MLPASPSCAPSTRPSRGWWRCAGSPLTRSTRTRPSWRASGGWLTAGPTTAGTATSCAGRLRLIGP
eukprot:13423647-Alexandrium_andersonii.AAC.1